MEQDPEVLKQIVKGDPINIFIKQYNRDYGRFYFDYIDGGTIYVKDKLGTPGSVLLRDAIIRKAGCQHDWKIYRGLRFDEKYCTRCPEKHIIDPMKGEAA